MKLAIVTPAYAGERQILEISCAHLDRFCDSRTEHIVIVSRHEKKLFKHIENRSRRILIKEDIIEEFVWRLPFLVRRDGLSREVFFVNGIRPLSGWFFQQIVKLAAPDMTDADVIIYLDSDVFLIKQFSPSDFIRDGKVRLFRKPGDAASTTHLQWHKAAGRLLGLPESRYFGADYIGHFVSWRRDVCLELRDRLENIWERPWTSVVFRERNLSEYILYGIFVDQVLGGDSGRHYSSDEELCLSSWKFDAESDLVPQFLKALGPRHLAVNLQSNLGLPIEQYRTFLASVIEGVAPG